NGSRHPESPDTRSHTRSQTHPESDPPGVRHLESPATKPAAGFGVIAQKSQCPVAHRSVGKAKVTVYLTHYQVINYTESHPQPDTAEPCRHTRFTARETVNVTWTSSLLFQVWANPH